MFDAIVLDFSNAQMSGIIYSNVTPYVGQGCPQVYKMPSSSTRANLVDPSALRMAQFHATQILHVSAVCDRAAAIAERAGREVWLGHLWTRQDDSVSWGPELKGEKIKTVCKLARGAHYVESLAKEAANYQGSLNSLQGHLVPKFFGFFTGRFSLPKRASLDAADVEAACIILQYVGMPIRSSEFANIGRGSEDHCAERLG